MKQRFKTCCIPVLICCFGLSGCGDRDIVAETPEQNKVGMEDAPVIPEQVSQDPDLIESIAGFDPSNAGASFRTLHLLAGQESKGDFLNKTEELTSLLSSEQWPERFAAIYFLGLVIDESNAAILVKSLGDKDERLRVMAAGSLIGLGEKRSIPVLIDAISSEELMPFSRPSTPLALLSADALPHFTEGDFELLESKDSVSLGEAADKWKQWWKSKGDDLEWAAAEQKYK